MALHHGIRVEVMSGGQSLPLYADPKEVLEPESLPYRQYYLQAVTDAPLEIKLSLTKDFVMGCDYLRIGVNYGDDRWYGYYYGNYSCKRMWLLQRKDPVFHFETIVHYDVESGGWRRMYVSCGSLDAEETSESSLASADMQDLGNISVSVTRVAASLGPEPLLEAKPELDPRIYDPLPGPEGVSMTFNLAYRSKETLQLYGCMPQTPDGEAEISEAASITTEPSTWNEDDTSTLNPEKETGVLAVGRRVWRTVVGKVQSAGQQSRTLET